MTGGMTSCEGQACDDRPGDVVRRSEPAMSGGRDPLSPRAIARAALRDREAWVVGGAVRDELLGRQTADVDIVVEGDAGAAARVVARAARGTAFELSDAFGSWRVMAPDRAWQVDLSPLREGSLLGDLALRDFTVNAIAVPLRGGERVDPHGGAADLAAGRLRAVGPRALADDPLRVVRLVRLAAQLALEPDAQTIALARASAPASATVAQERVFAELKRIVAGDGVVGSLALMDEIGLTPAILPELHALRGVEQNRYHHADVHGHTIEVLEQTIALQADPGAVFGAEHAHAIEALLAEPLGDEVDRGFALRLGALLHDIAKPATQGRREDGSPTFLGHDRAGAELAREILARLRASEKLKAHVAALARHHLRLGFLVHETPLSRRALYGYLKTSEPVEVDVTLLSVADRLATRGRKAQESIAKHLELAREVMPAALAWRAQGRRRPLVRGDVLATALEIASGPQLGVLLAEIDAARFAGEVRTPEEAVALAARLLERRWRRDPGA
jgi:poly(A) polymerase